MLPLTKEETKSHHDAKARSISRKKNVKKPSKSINYWKIRDPCPYTGKYRGSANLKLNVSN